MSLNYKTKVEISDPIHIYYSVEANNLDTTGTKAPVVFDINENRQNPFLGCPQNYNMSIIKFGLNGTKSLPVFIPVIEDPSVDVDKTIYKIGIYTNSSSFTILSVDWVPQLDNTLWVPPQLQPTQSLSDYYFCYDYDHFLNLINARLAQAYNTQNGSLNGVPYFELDADTFNINLYYSTSIYNGTYLITMNEAMWNLFSTFNHEIIPSPAPGISRQYYLRPTPSPIPINPEYTYVAVGPTNVPYYKYVSKNTPLVMWNPIKNIVFTSSTLPVVGTNITQKNFYADSNALIGAGNAAIANIVTSFTATINANNSFKQQLIYLPTAEFRCISMTGTNPLSNLQISIFWTDIYNNVRPFYLNSSCSVNFEILFRRVDYNIPTETMLLMK